MGSLASRGQLAIGQLVFWRETAAVGNRRADRQSVPPCRQRLDFLLTQLIGVARRGAIEVGLGSTSPPSPTAALHRYSAQTQFQFLL